MSVFRKVRSVLPNLRFYPKKTEKSIPFLVLLETSNYAKFQKYDRIWGTIR